MNNQDRLNAFKKISIHNRLDPFFEEDIECYYEDPDEFSLVLKRSKTELSLYGSKHVSLRQSFFNELTIDQRRQLFLSKLKSANVYEWVITQLKIKFSDILDVVDIGKGRSIYKICLKNNAFVIKEKTNNSQFIFNQVAEKFQMPAPKSFFLESTDKFWELTEFLDDQEVFHEKKEALVGICAKSAAFGDFIELGDRHFENYISRDHDLVAIDVTHLMDDDNEHWTKKYVAGGLYEVCILQYYVNDLPSFKYNVETFFNAYFHHAKHLFELKKDIKPDEKTLKQIKKHWVDLNQFIQHMHHIYNESLVEMFDRICYKSLLETLVKKNIELEEYPELKMYYLADQGRISTFFQKMCLIRLKN